MALTAYDHRRIRTTVPAPGVPAVGARVIAFPLPVERPLDRATAYRRRRMVAAALAMALLMSLGYLASATGVFSLASTPSTAPGAAAVASPPVAPSVHIVQPGDTLWSIARELRPAGDIRPLVDRLAERHGAALQVGDRIDLSGLG